MHTAKGQLLDFYSRPVDNIDPRTGKTRWTKTLSDHYSRAYVENCAHFVCDDEIMKLCLSPEADKTYKAMKDANVLALPFDPMLLEFRVQGTVRFVRLTSKPEFPYNSVMANARMGVSEDVCAYPLVMIPDNHTAMRNGGLLGLEEGFYLSVSFSAIREDAAFTVYCGKEDKLSEELGLSTAMAMRLAFFMLNTKGVATERVSTAKIDRIRLKKGRAKINDYHVMRVGYLYDKDGKRHERGTSGRHMPVHWRIGHVRNMPFGPAKKDGEWIPIEDRPHRQIFIPPCLVNYDPETKAPLPKVEVIGRKKK